MKDLILDENLDLIIKNGDFVIDDSTLQDAMLILSTAPGNWKQFPAIGVDIENMINNDANFNEIKRLFKQHLKYDEKKLTGFKIENGIVKIDVEND